MLGSSIPGTELQRATKASAPSTSREKRVTAPVSSQGPNQNTVPNSGNTCGRRERGSRNEARGETSLRVTFVSVTVKGILAFWKAALFAECRRKESLDRSVTCIGYPPEAGGAPVTADVRRSPRRGTLSACARKRMRGALARSLRVIRGRVLRSVLRPVHVNPHYTHRGASFGGGATGRHHGWANPRKREEPSLGSVRRT